MTKNFKPTAWMIRSDGKEIPVPFHISGNLENRFETIYAAEWLYDNTALFATRQLVLRFLGAYAKSMDMPEKTAGQALNQLIKQKSSYLFMSESFLLKHYDEISYNDSNVNALNREVVNALNREFIRARYGGLHETVPRCKEMHICVYNEKPDWTDAIYRFIMRHIEWICEVRIWSVQPETGKMARFYGPNECFRNTFVYTLMRDMLKDQDAQLDKITHDLSFYHMDTWSEAYFSVPIFKRYIIPAYDYIKKYMLEGYIRAKDVRLVRELERYSSGFDVVEALCPDEIGICRDVANGLLQLIQGGWDELPECKGRQRLLRVMVHAYIEMEDGCSGSCIDKTINLDDLENEVPALIEVKRQREEWMRKEEAEIQPQ